MAKKEPDLLDIESSMAIAAGMSYGKFKAMQYERNQKTTTDCEAARHMENLRTLRQRISSDRQSAQKILHRGMPMRLQ